MIIVYKILRLNGNRFRLIGYRMVEHTVHGMHGTITIFIHFPTKMHMVLAIFNFTNSPNPLSMKLFNRNHFNRDFVFHSIACFSYVQQAIVWIGTVEKLHWSKRLPPRNCAIINFQPLCGSNSVSIHCHQRFYFVWQFSKQSHHFTCKSQLKSAQNNILNCGKCHSLMELTWQLASIHGTNSKQPFHQC